MIIFSFVAIFITILIKLTSKGPILHWSKRIGKNNKIFLMPKFRTMRADTPQVATHLLVDSHRYVTPVGRFLRASSLDELPQLWCILKGEMSFVGPRPALFNQDDLVLMRSRLGIEKLTPGITGWAQVCGRDSIPLERKVELDYEYLRGKSFLFDLRILFLTFFRVISADDISH